jgi:hypothetical protein
MQVRVKSLQGDEYIIQVQNDQTVLQLKTSIQEKANGLPTDRQRLVYKGRTMQDSFLISDYNLEEDCKVHLIVQKERGAPSTSTNQTVGSTINPNEASTSAANDAPNSSQSSSSQCPMDTSTNLTSKSNEEVIRMLGQWGSMGQKTADDGARTNNQNSGSSSSNNNNNDNNSSKNNDRKPSRFELILRERLAAHFPSGSIDQIMENLYQEIDDDINSSSLDDLERLAKQKLKITNE